jgi:hypothetical protein
VVVEFSAMTAYLDLCGEHLGELLLGARPADVKSFSVHRSDERGVGQTNALS